MTDTKNHEQNSTRQQSDTERENKGEAKNAVIKAYLTKSTKSSTSCLPVLAESVMDCKS